MVLGNLGQFTTGPVLPTLHVNINTSFIREWKQRWYPLSAAGGTGRAEVAQDLRKVTERSFSINT